MDSTKAEVFVKIVVTTRKASTVTNANQHFIDPMTNYLTLPMFANVRKNKQYQTVPIRF